MLSLPCRVVVFASVLLAMCLGAVGCHSAMVDATVANHSGAEISLLEVDYPSASFGTQNLAAGGEFHYRFKVLGSGVVKVTYTDVGRHDHASTGPTLHEGAEGLLLVTLDPAGVRWQTTLKQRP